MFTGTYGFSSHKITQLLKVSHSLSEALCTINFILTSLTSIHAYLWRMFKFNFSADDLEFDDPLVAEQQDDDEVDQISKPLEDLTVSEGNLIPASLLDLQSKTCYHSLPSTLHYELAHIPVTKGSGAANAVLTTVSTGAEKEVVTLYKRNLEDVKFQMAQEDDEFDVEESANKPNEITGTTTTSGPGGVEMLALAGKSDLVKGVYEGGLKTWECALDLVAYLAENKECYDAKKVLELGCGSALPGIYLLTQSSSVKVDLQDYNDQVLKLVTLPNVLLNTHIRPDQQPVEEEKDENDNEEIPRKALLQKVGLQSRFFMGDWAGLVDLLDFKSDDDKYDLILTSETIYAEESHMKLYTTIKNSLKRGGKALVAAKTFYFGVGGDILSFRRLIEKDGAFDVKVVFSAQAFVRREILELTFKA
ncbi:hypothetical protein MVEG_09159 [Podila verticillata NRRL 6337]|nr:hypothetical protein MVEG_09159 [Podila verticillata NRRL 6337]